MTFMDTVQCRRITQPLRKLLIFNQTQEHNVNFENHQKI